MADTETQDDIKQSRSEISTTLMKAISITRIMGKLAVHDSERDDPDTLGDISFAAEVVVDLLNSAQARVDGFRPIADSE